MDAETVRTSIVDWTGEHGNVDHQRLRAALLDAERRELKARGTPNGSLGRQRCLALALAECKAGRYFSAWDNLHQFDLEFLETLDEEGRRVARVGLVEEAKDKLVGWRRQTVESLDATLTDHEVPSLEWVRQVRMQLATQAQNSWHKRHLLGKRVLPVLVASLATTALFLFAGWQGWFDLPLGKAMATPLLMGALAGFLGGVISVATSITTADLQAKIPDLRHAGIVTLLRPSVGALCAIPVVFLVQSEFVKLGNLSLLWTTVALCLATGFSERWFLGLMESLTAKAKA